MSLTLTVRVWGEKKDKKIIFWKDKEMIFWKDKKDNLQKDT